MGSTPSAPEVPVWEQKLPPLPKLAPQVPPQPGVDLRAAVENEVAVCAAWTRDLHGHGCRVGVASDALLGLGEGDVTPSKLAFASATLGADIQAHADASKEHAPRCIRALEWCAAASKKPTPVPAPPAAAATPAAGVARPQPEPLSPEAAAQCASLRSALLAHHGLMSEELVPRLHVLQQVFLHAVNADKPPPEGSGSSSSSSSNAAEADDLAK